MTWAIRYRLHSLHDLTDYLLLTLFILRKSVAAFNHHIVSVMETDAFCREI